MCSDAAMPFYLEIGCAPDVDIVHCFALLPLLVDSMSLHIEGHDVCDWMEGC